MPSTTAGPGAVGTPSARMPAHLRRHQQVVGPLESGQHAVRQLGEPNRRPRRRATPASNGSQAYALGGNGGQPRSGPRGAGAEQHAHRDPGARAGTATRGRAGRGRRSAVRRPRPGPSGSPARAASTTSAFVEPVSARTSSRVQSSPGPVSARSQRPGVERWAVEIGVRRAGHPASLRPATRAGRRRRPAAGSAASRHPAGTVTPGPAPGPAAGPVRRLRRRAAVRPARTRPAAAVPEACRAGGAGGAGGRARARRCAGPAPGLRGLPGSALADPRPGGRGGP